MTRTLFTARVALTQTACAHARGIRGNRAVQAYWRGVPAVIVSLLGWLMVVRGVLLMAFPDTFLSIANRTIDAETLWRTVFGIFVLVGLYLTYVGWFTRPRSSVSQSPGSISDLPRAA